MRVSKRIGYWIAIAACALSGGLQARAQVSLATVVDLAMRNSTAVKIAEANVQHATASLQELKDVYIPNVALSAGIGPPSYGFPQGQPTLYDITTQSLIFSPAQLDYVRAAKAALKSAQLNLKDSEEQTAMDTALAYLQLDHDLQLTAAQQEEKVFADKLVDVERDRLLAGVDSRLAITRAELTSAQIEAHRLQLEDDAELMRQKLAHFTGLPASSFITDTKSIPSPPEILSDTNYASRILDANAGVQSAYANSQSKQLLFSGDKKQNYRPQFAFGAQYSRYAEFNNYQEYYLHFQQNNFGAEVQITVPLFDANKRAKARESAADAARAGAEADQAMHQADEQVFTLNHNIAELKAQQRIAELQSEIAQEELETVQSQLKNGSGSPNAAPVTPKDEQLAHIQERQRYQEVLDARFQVMRVELSLMRSLGEVANWAHIRPLP
jgi:outer membrane protein TolC